MRRGEREGRGKREEKTDREGGGGEGRMRRGRGGIERSCVHCTCQWEKR